MTRMIFVNVPVVDLPRAMAHGAAGQASAMQTSDE
jgi:hypothetical protein